jgi:serine/threonine protein kinase
LIFLPKKIDLNNEELEGVFNERYKMVKKLGEGAQGTVYEVEDLNEDRKRLIYFYLCSKIVNLSFFVRYRYRPVTVHKSKEWQIIKTINDHISVMSVYCNGHVHRNINFQ